MQTAVDLLPKIKNSVGKLERDKDLIFKTKLTEKTGKKKDTRCGKSPRYNFKGLDSVEKVSLNLKIRQVDQSKF